MVKLVKLILKGVFVDVELFRCLLQGTVTGKKRLEDLHILLPFPGGDVSENLLHVLPLDAVRKLMNKELNVDVLIKDRRVVFPAQAGVQSLLGAKVAVVDEPC